MIVVYIERWSGIDGSVQYPWSVWNDGHRLDMGGPFASPDEAQTEARAYCLRTLGREPDRVLRL